MNARRHDPRRRAWMHAAMLPLLGAAAGPGLLAGCGLTGGQRTDFHLLRDAGAGQAGATAPPRVDLVLMVASDAMPGLYDGDRMVFSADGRARSYFQFGYWSERPAQTLMVLTQMRLAAAQRFREVVLSTSGVRGDLLLTLRLDELYYDAAQRPGVARLALTAELLDWRTRKLLARRRFEHATPVATSDAYGVAQAASQAVGAMLDEMVDWAANNAVAPKA